MLRQDGSEPSVQVWLLQPQQSLHQADKSSLMALLTKPVLAAMAAPLPCNINIPELPWSDLAWVWPLGLPAPWTVVPGPSWTLLAALWGYSLGCSIPVQ